MSKRSKLIVLMIIGGIMLVIVVIVILYLINGSSDNYSTDIYYLSTLSQKESMEVIEQIDDNNIKEPALEQSIKIVKPKDNKGSGIVTQLEIQKEIDVIVEAEQIEQEQNSEDNVVEQIIQDQISKELVVIQEVVEKKILTDVDSSNDEMIEYIGDKFIDTAINEYREEIEDEDIVFGLSILEKINSDVVYSFIEDGLTDVEKDQLTNYLHSVLTEGEYVKAKELFYKYSYILD